jgi:pre-mRNA-splicing helicase BRR2
VFTNDTSASELNWLGEGTTVVWLEGADDGTTSILIGDATKPGEK